MKTFEVLMRHTWQSAGSLCSWRWRVWRCWMCQGRHLLHTLGHRQGCQRSGLTSRKQILKIWYLIRTAAGAPSAFSSLTWIPFPLHPLLSVREQPLQSLQDVMQGGSQQRLNHRWQGFGGRSNGAVGGWWHLPHGCHKVAAADFDGGDVQQEFLWSGIDLRVATTQSAQRRLSAHCPDVSAAVTWETGGQLTSKVIGHLSHFCSVNLVVK